MFGKINKTCKIGNIKLQNNTGVGQVLVIQNIFYTKYFSVVTKKYLPTYHVGKLWSRLLTKQPELDCIVLKCQISMENQKPETPPSIQSFLASSGREMHIISTDSEPAHQLWLGRMHSPIKCAFNIFLANVEDIFLQHFPLKIFPKHST